MNNKKCVKIECWSTHAKQAISKYSINNERRMLIHHMKLQCMLKLFEPCPRMSTHPPHQMGSLAQSEIAT